MQCVTFDEKIGASVTSGTEYELGLAHGGDARDVVNTTEESVDGKCFRT